jgi:hypothetical protein
MSTKQNWPKESAIRERLALLADKGPDDCADWSYDPRFDRFFRMDESGGSMRRVNVTQEGSRSLELIAERWKLDRKTAMALIGYPEKG